MSSDSVDGDGSKYCVLFKLPLEVRRHIYGYLVRAKPVSSVKSAVIDVAKDAEHSSSTAMPAPGINITAFKFQHRHSSAAGPSTCPQYTTRDHRGQTQSSTYALYPKQKLDVAILRTSKKIYSEAASVLYGENLFDFTRCLEGIAPFLSTLRPATTALIKLVKIEKKAQAYDKEFDVAEWKIAMRALSQLKLEVLTLIVATGDPQMNFSSSSMQFGVGLRGYIDADWPKVMGKEGFEWIDEMCTIKCLRELKIETRSEVCPPPVSIALERWLRLSKSVDGTFAAFVKPKMLR